MAGSINPTSAANVTPSGIAMPVAEAAPAIQSTISIAPGLKFNAENQEDLKKILQNIKESSSMNALQTLAFLTEAQVAAAREDVATAQRDVYRSTSVPPSEHSVNGDTASPTSTICGSPGYNSDGELSSSATVELIDLTIKSNQGHKITKLCNSYDGLEVDPRGSIVCSPSESALHARRSKASALKLTGKFANAIEQNRFRPTKKSALNYNMNVTNVPEVYPYKHIRNGDAWTMIRVSPLAPNGKPWARADLLQYHPQHIQNSLKGSCKELEASNCPKIDVETMEKINNLVVPDKASAYTLEEMLMKAAGFSMDDPGICLFLSGQMGFAEYSQFRKLQLTKEDMNTKNAGGGIITGMIKEMPLKGEDIAKCEEVVEEVVTVGKGVLGMTADMEDFSDVFNSGWFYSMVTNVNADQEMAAAPPPKRRCKRQVFGGRIIASYKSKKNRSGYALQSGEDPTTIVGLDLVIFKGKDAMLDKTGKPYVCPVFENTAMDTEWVPKRKSAKSTTTNKVNTKPPKGATASKKRALTKKYQQMDEDHLMTDADEALVGADDISDDAPRKKVKPSKKRMTFAEEINYKIDLGYLFDYEAMFKHIIEASPIQSRPDQPLSLGLVSAEEVVAAVLLYFKVPFVTRENEATGKGMLLAIEQAKTKVGIHYRNDQNNPIWKTPDLPPRLGNLEWPILSGTNDPENVIGKAKKAMASKNATGKAKKAMAPKSKICTPPVAGVRKNNTQPKSSRNRVPGSNGGIPDDLLLLGEPQLKNVPKPAVSSAITRAWGPRASQIMPAREEMVSAEVAPAPSMQNLRPRRSTAGCISYAEGSDAEPEPTNDVRMGGMPMSPRAQGLDTEQSDAVMVDVQEIPRVQDNLGSGVASPVAPMVQAEADIPLVGPIALADAAALVREQYDMTPEPLTTNRPPSIIPATIRAPTRATVPITSSTPTAEVASGSCSSEIGVTPMAMDEDNHNVPPPPAYVVHDHQALGPQALPAGNVQNNVPRSYTRPRRTTSGLTNTSTPTTRPTSTFTTTRPPSLSAPRTHVTSDDTGAPIVRRSTKIIGRIPWDMKERLVVSYGKLSGWSNSKTSHAASIFRVETDKEGQYRLCRSENSCDSTWSRNPSNLKDLDVILYEQRQEFIDIIRKLRQNGFHEGAQLPADVEQELSSVATN